MPDLASLVDNVRVGVFTQPLEGDTVVLGGNRSNERMVPFSPTAHASTQSTTERPLSWLS